MAEGRTVVRRTTAAIAAAAVLAVGWRAGAPPGRLPAETTAASLDSAARYVVGLVDRRADAALLARDHGLRLERGLSALGAVVLEDRSGSAAAALARLRADPRVRSASLELELGLAAGCCEAEDQGPGLEAWLEAARARQAALGGALRARTAGAPGVIVAVLDTGCDAAHPDLAGALVPGLSLLPGEPWGEDKNGHGTAMASLVVGRGVVAGVAPGVQVLPVRLAGASGRAALSDVAAGIVAAVERGASVVLLSLGARRPAPLLEDAVRWAEERGVLVVAAAGNASAGVDLFPAASQTVLSVGSLEDDGRLAFATALAPTTDVLAPGVGAAIALPGGRRGGATGSSVAAARVAAAAALVRSLAPELPPERVRDLLRRSARPLEALRDAPDAARALRAGALDASAAAGMLLAPGARLRLADARLLPPCARPGERVLGLVRVENHGLEPSSPTELELELGGARARAAVPALAPLGEALVRVELLAPGPGRARFALASSPAGVEVELPSATRPWRDLGLVEARGVAGPDGELELRGVVEGRGANQGGLLRAFAAGTLVGAVAVPALSPGERSEATFALDPTLASPEGYLPVRLELAPGDDDPGDDVAGLDLLAPDAVARGAQTQYQQDDQLNLIADAPHRLEPGRPYLPLLVFMPEKGDLNPGTWVELSRVRITSRATPTSQPGVPDLVVYDDQRGGATVAPPGLVITDEEGRPVLQGGAPDPRLFQHGRLSEPGRYAILRLPRAAFGLAAAPTAAEDRFLEVSFEWRHRRQLLFTTNTRTGTRRWVLRVTFGSDPRPRFAGEDGYYDAHCHTIAEWYQDDTFDPLAPKRNFCGPLPMLAEVAHAVGLTDAVDAVRGRVITTDHNAALNPGDVLRERPQLGPSSPASSRGLSEWDRYRELFGVTAAEEVTLESWGNTSVGSVTVPTPGESHLLSYRAEHVLGPWHGVSALAPLQGQTFPRVRIEDVVQRLTRTNRQENRRAAAFPAHPFGGDWSADDFRTAFEQDPARRTDGSVHQEQTGFLVKGLQFWNSDGKRHKLEPSLIDWDDLNPWADPVWQRGRADWDDKLHDGLGRWHREFLEPLLSYELKARPGVRFPRKVFALAGNDAHGDFNFQSSRKATILRQQSSFEVSYRAFGRCLTYALTGLQPAGAPPEERAFEAFLDGNAVLTDGPLLRFSLDTEDRFDGQRLQWHDARRAHEDADGRIGGGGDFDGRGTALVPRGSPHLRLGYRWACTAELGGDVERIEVYRTSPGDPNPVGQKPSGDPLLLARGSLVPGAPQQDHEEALDPAEEGLITAPSVLALGATTHADPATMGPDERRCYTNPVWCVPFSADVAVVQSQVDAQGVGWIPPGGLRVRLDFDMSLLPLPYALEVKGLDAAGDSTDRSLAPLDVLAPVGWSDLNGVKDARYELSNAVAIPLDGPRWPAPDQVTFVVYARDPLLDAFGNELHRIAVTFSTAGVGAPRPAWPVPGGGGTTTTPGTTAPGATPGAAPPAGGGGGGGSCALQPGERGSGGGSLAVLLLLAMMSRACCSPRRRRS